MVQTKETKQTPEPKKRRKKIESTRKELKMEVVNARRVEGTLQRVKKPTDIGSKSRKTQQAKETKSKEKSSVHC